MAGITLLATSDLHMRISSYDYIRDKPSDGPSLARLVRHIRTLRQQAEEEGRVVLMVDNGDLLQGSPLAACLAGDAAQTGNPMADCLNALEYDAAGLGNHDFDHGLSYLNKALSSYRMPVVCSNLQTDEISGLKPYVVLERQVPCPCGDHRVLRIGIVSVLPRQTLSWNRHHLSGQARISDPVHAADSAACAARAAGAELVIALAHMGIARFDEGENPQNEVKRIAGLSSVDAVVGGHTHLRFPGPDHSADTDTDPLSGMVHGKPVVMPGYAGSHLGHIRIDAKWPVNGGALQVTQTQSELAAPCPETKEDDTIVRFSDAAHKATRTFLNEPVARLVNPMNSFFALARPSAVPALIAAAKHRFIRDALRGSELEHLPLLSAAATASTGGFDGPDNFIDLPGGALMRRHIVALSPYANQIWAVRTTGARLVEWLERSAVIYRTLEPEAPDQMLVDDNIPGFRYDTIYGLTYEIDPACPPRFDPVGRPLSTGEGRIKNVRWNDRPLDPDQEFLVATSDHRTGGGGALRAFDEDEIVLRGRAPTQEGLVRYLQDPDCDAIRSAEPWRFVTSQPVSAILLTSPAAVHVLSEIENLRPEICGHSPAGFARIRIHL